jgi:serine/threonine-protein kinase
MDTKTFLAHLQRSRLIRRRDLKAVAPRLPRSGRGRLVARALVEWGLLTKFQAELLLAGRTSGFFLGQYRILDQIGQGGMGRVFKAVHQTMNRVVALKILSPHLVKTERTRWLFQREVQAAARLIHPNIVTAYDANRVGDRHYLVMEYVNGPSLEQLVREMGPLPVGFACEVIRQVAHGLQFASEHGMVHRDIKPANILIQSADSRLQLADLQTDQTNVRESALCTLQSVIPKITDFGLARMHAGDEDIPPATDPAKKNVVMGTPDYLSPEQSRSVDGVDIRSDLYSLGGTFYYLLTGKVPFPGGTPLEKIIRHCTEEPMPIEQLRPELPAGIVAIVRKLMAKDASDRFQTPLEVANVLMPFAVPGPLPTGRGSDTDPAVQAATDLDTTVPDDGALRLLSAGLSARSAMVNTLNGGQSPTPISAPEMQLAPVQAAGKRSGSGRWKRTLGVMGGLAVLGLGLSAWVFLR